MVRPWSPICVVAAMATSSTRSGGSCGLRRINSRMQRITRSSARVSAYMPAALPNGVRTPSTKTTSRTSRGTASLPDEWNGVILLVGNYAGPAHRGNVTPRRRSRSGGTRVDLRKSLGDAVGDQRHLPGAGAETAQRIAHRLRGDLVRRGPRQPADEVRADQIFRRQGVRL